ncbi:MAG: MFS transporter [Bacteroidales bacterium]
MNNKKVLIAVSLGIFLCMLDTTIMNITLPAIQESLNVELKDLSWALNVYTIVFASLTIPLAKLSELWGKEKAFVCSLGLFMISSLLCGLSSNLTLLIISRLLQGVSASVLFPLSMIIGVSNTSIEQRDKIIAILGVTQGFAAAVGPTLGGVISQFLGWHWVFWVNVPIGLIALVLAV